MRNKYTDLASPGDSGELYSSREDVVLYGYRPFVENKKSSIYGEVCSKLFWKSGELDMWIPEYGESEEVVRSKKEVVVPKQENPLKLSYYNLRNFSPYPKSKKIKNKKKYKKSNSSLYFSHTYGDILVELKTIQKSFEDVQLYTKRVLRTVQDSAENSVVGSLEPDGSGQVSVKMNLSSNKLSGWLSLIENSYLKILRESSFSRKKYSRLSSQLKSVLKKTVAVNSDSKFEINGLLEKLKVRIKLHAQPNATGRHVILLSVLVPNRYYIYPLDEEEAFVVYNPQCFP